MTITPCVVFRKIFFIYLVVSLLISAKQRTLADDISLTLDTVSKSSPPSSSLEDNISAAKSQGPDNSTTKPTTIAINDDVDIKLENIKIDNIILKRLRNNLAINALDVGIHQKNEDNSVTSVSLRQKSPDNIDSAATTKPRLVSGGSAVVDNDRIKEIKANLPPIHEFSDLEAVEYGDSYYEADPYSFTALENDGSNKDELKPPCILGTAAEYLEWWIRENGTLSNQGW